MIAPSIFRSKTSSIFLSKKIRSCLHLLSFVEKHLLYFVQTQEGLACLLACFFYSSFKNIFYLSFKNIFYLSFKNNKVMLAPFIFR